MHDNQPRTSTPDTLPEVITHYLTAHRAHDTATAITAFTREATVIDDGNTYGGTEAIREWLGRSATDVLAERTAEETGQAQETVAG
ncbi:hypothetical protein [Streptomyces chattanoogensis]|uniref:hypothetical protein n=1 Tax=Streptomyces chattanoogensis TaxID=66876 RepID=UPI00099DEB87|nr:hypothetical protein [Streptomyces chattanoogensis]